LRYEKVLGAAAKVNKERTYVRIHSIHGRQFYHNRNYVHSFNLKGGEMSNFCRWWSKHFREDYKLKSSDKVIQNWCRLAWEGASEPYKESIATLEKQLSDCQRKLKEAMKMSNEERYKEALERILTMPVVVPHSRAGLLQETARNALSPPPVTETVEHKIYVIIDTSNGQMLASGTLASVQHRIHETPENKLKIVEHVGTYTRPSPRKVTRREEIIVKCGDYQLPISREYRSFTGLEKIYREWEEES